MNDTGSGKRGRPPGLPKTGGRTRGTPNKSTLLMHAKLAEFGCDPVQELLSIARNPDTSEAVKVSIYSGFMRFSYATPKPITCDEEPLPEQRQLTVEEALKWAHYLIDRFDPHAPSKTEKHVDEKAEMSKNSVEDNENEETS